MTLSSRFSFGSVVDTIGDVVDDVVDGVGSIVDDVGSDIGSLLPNLQKQNIKSLFQTIKTSVDVPLIDIDFRGFKSTVKDAWSDRTITLNEFTDITVDAIEIVASTGVAPWEAQLIFYAVQEIAETARLPKIRDELIGTLGDDTLWGGLGKDLLTGISLDSLGVGEIDTLFGGSGKDLFVLGNEAIAYYNDALTETSGLEDYAILLDFNPLRDKIQLHGEVTDYILGALPADLAMTGTGIYYNSSATTSAPELVGAVMGTALTDFNTGFTFV